MFNNVNFTPREIEVASLVAQAKCRKAIAVALNIALSTVDKHMHSIFLKTKTTSTTELMLWLMNNCH